MEAYSIFLVKPRAFTCLLNQIEVCRNGGVVINVTCRANKTVEVNDHESTNAGKFERLMQCSVNLS